MWVDKAAKSITDATHTNHNALMQFNEHSQ